LVVFVKITNSKCDSLTTKFVLESTLKTDLICVVTENKLEG